MSRGGDVTCKSGHGSGAPRRGMKGLPPSVAPAPGLRCLHSVLETVSSGALPGRGGARERADYRGVLVAGLRELVCWSPSPARIGWILAERA